MEAILLTRLSTFASNIETVAKTVQALCEQYPWSKEQLEQSGVAASKLQSIVNRFNSDLYQYFKLTINPNADEISELTVSQLKGEQTLAEINALLQQANKTPLPSEQNVITHRSKLPDLHLQTFKGDLLTWYPFWDQFQSTIGQRDLSNVDKLLYLKAALEGEPKTMIEGLETTNQSYEIAVDTLKNRYGRRDLVIDAHYSTLYKLRPAVKFEDCRKTLDELERHLRVLQTLGEDIGQNHLRFMIIEKFPEDIVYEVKLKVNSESIEDLRKQLDVVITAREEARGCKIKEESRGESSFTTGVLHVGERRKRVIHRNGGSYGRKNRTTPVQSKVNFTALAQTFSSRKRPHEQWRGRVDERVASKRMKWQCIFCSGPHYNDQCKEVQSIYDRRRKLMDRCLKCLRKNHRAFECKVKVTCPHCRSVGSHNRALCPQKFAVQSDSKPSTVLHAHHGESTILQTAVVTAVGRNGVTKGCRLLMDCGSQRSYVTEKVAKELELEVEDENHLFVFTFGSTKPQKIISDMVRICLKTREGELRLLYVNVVPVITQGISSPQKEIVDCVHDFNQDFTLADDDSLQDRVDILIGNDYYYSLMGTEKVQLKENLYLVESDFGWILSGMSKKRCKEDDLSVLTYFQSSYESKLYNPDSPIDMGNVKNLWELESIGITDAPDTDRDEEAVRNFNKTTTVENGRYVVSWPWNVYPPELPSNYGLAYGRLLGLMKRMDKDTLLAYEKVLKYQSEKGIIEIVPDDVQEDHPIHFLPHHPVSSEGKAIRIVYDASAKVKDKKSLNECLYRGPVMLEDITGLLIKFRCHKIALTADVEKAFLQIGLHEKDRDVTRFLWIKDASKPVDNENLLVYRFTRVPFGVISSPYLLNATIRHHLERSEHEHVRKLANDIYVDNLLTGADSVQNAVRLYKDCRSSFNQISMNIREWCSNSEELNEVILDLNKTEVVKTLGLDWNVVEDTLRIRCVFKNNAVTKRGLLKTIAAIYDPCGFVAPIVLPAKLLLQSLWKENKKWDTLLSKESSQNWSKILEDLKDVREVRLPRIISQSNECQLHCFTDSSLRAYAVVVYLLQQNNLRLIMGKSRLAPLKDKDSLKIPRLELLAVLIGNRLLRYIAKYLPMRVTKQTLWCDSQIVISWWQSEKLLTPFVSRRIEEIKRNKALEVRYVPSELNPADVATRPLKNKDEIQFWLQGPEFLLKEIRYWPERTMSENSFLARESSLENVSVSATKDREIVESVREDSTEDNGAMFSNEVSSEVKEFRRVQKQYFPEEVKGKKTPLARSLGLFVDVDGVLRSEGRLTHSDLSYDMKHPILLPKDCDLTIRIIKEIHEGNYHIGVPHTLSKVRQRFWIPQGRYQVQKVINKCPQCVRHGGGPYPLPSTPALPPERVRYEAPFAYVGVDYFGPMLIRMHDGQKKRWICLFTCLVIRAIHLEVVGDMSAEECSLAFRRFMAMRGVPSLVISDNALCFKLLAEILSRVIPSRNVQWKFIPQLAPWHGGVYERLVALVKHCLKRTLEKHLLGESQLATVIKEVETIVNTRPLTYVGEDGGHVLKPADFLSSGRCFSSEDLVENMLSSGSSTRQQLIEGWKKGKVIIGEYKEMFVNQYLLSLRERYGHSSKQSRILAKKIPRIGDVVQIRGESKNRGNWKVGFIIELIKGSDGQCRVAKVKVGENVFIRSIAHLYPLEADEIISDDFLNRDLRKEDSSSVIVDADHSSAEVIVPSVDVVTRSQSEKRIEMSKMDVTEEVRKDTGSVLIDDNVQEMDGEVHNRSDRVDKVSREIESVCLDPVNLNKSNNPDEVEGNEMAGVQFGNERHKRLAAVQAMEKIKDWTRHLLLNIACQK